MNAGIPIERALTLVGELLAADGQPARIVLVGGAALNLLGIVERTTQDVDIIAVAVEDGGALRLLPPEPLPLSLQRAIATVARDLEIPNNWMNTVVASQWRTGLPPGIAEETGGAQGLVWRRYGGLWVGLPARFALICLKLYAAADQTGPESRHYQDLLALAPTGAELARAAAWIGTQDPSLGEVVAKVIEHVGARLH